MQGERYQSHNEKRAPYEFDEVIKKQAFERSHDCCEECGVHISEARLEVDHRVAIWFALELKGAVPVVLINSLANAQVLCHSCHQIKHLFESRANYAKLAPQIMAAYLELSIDRSKDDWRKNILQQKLVPEYEPADEVW